MAIAAFGTLFQMGDGAAPENFTTVAEVVSIGGPSLSLDTVDVTNHSSPGGWEQVVGTVLRSGEITLELNYDPVGATHRLTTGLLGQMVAKTVRNYKIVFPNVGATTWSLSALVTGFEPSAAHEDKLSASVTLKVSGQPSLA